MYRIQDTMYNKLYIIVFLQPFSNLIFIKKMEIYYQYLYVYVYIYISRSHDLLKICVISNNILNEIRCIIENANDVLRHRLSTPFDSPDFLRMASDAYAGPGWSTTRHDDGRSLHV